MKRADAPYINGLRVSLHGGELYIDVRVGPAQYCVDMKTDTFDPALVATALSVLNANCGGRVVTLSKRPSAKASLGKCAGTQSMITPMPRWWR